MTKEEQKIALLVHRIKDNCYEVAENLLKEHDKQIRTEAIEELSDLIDRLLWDYDMETYKDLSESFKESARLLKEQK